MKTKSILAVLASAVTGFLFGWLVWGIALMGYYQSNMVQYPGLMKEPPIWSYFLGNLAVGGLFVYALHHLAGITSFSKGVLAAMILTLLSTLPYEIMFYTGMNLYPAPVLVVDLVANTVMGGLMGGVAVLVASYGKKGE
jgi:hypothetical protein